jgi:nucleotide-binding universal stress UspA family protein
VSAALAEQDLRRIGQDVVDQALAVARETAPETPASTEVWRDAVYDMIVRESRQASYLVLGSRPRSAFRPSLGSVVAVAAMSAHCPVVAVPPDWDGTKESGPVVVAVSRHQDVEPLVAAGIEESRSRGTSVVVLHAWRPPDAYLHALATREDDRRWTEEVERELAEATAGVRGDNPDVAVRVVARFEPVGRALSDITAGAALLVVGRHRTSFGLVPRLGRVPHTALHLDLCPVQVMPGDSADGDGTPGPGHAPGR